MTDVGVQGGNRNGPGPWSNGVPTSFAEVPISAGTAATIHNVIRVIDDRGQPPVVVGDLDPNPKQN
jgi:hypothetical protein